MNVIKIKHGILWRIMVMITKCGSDGIQTTAGLCMQYKVTRYKVGIIKRCGWSEI